MSNLRNVNIHDSSGNTIGSLSNALNTHDADVHNVVLNKQMHQTTATSNTLSVATTGGGTEYQITLNDATGFSANDYIKIGTSERTFAKIISIATNTLTLDRRIDYANAIGTTVTKVIIDMSSQSGSMASPQTYEIAPESGEVWHITKLLFSMTYGSAGDLGLFGNITALTNGVVFRCKVSGQYSTFSLWRDNSDIKEDMFDLEFYSRSGAGATHGNTGQGKFKEAGAVVRLDGTQGDKIEVVIQDDITALSSFGMKLQGHIEG